MAPFLALTGFMGSGKSSVGAEVAALLGWRFLDLDDEFVRVEGGIAEFFATKGEAAFRARELALLDAVLGGEEEGRGLMLALGGGTLESPGAVDLLRGRGGLLFLDADPEEAWARVEGGDRPLAQDRGRFLALMARRRAVYENTADWVIPVGKESVSDLSREIVEIVQAAGEHWQTLWGRRLRATERSSAIVGGKNALSTLKARAASAREAGSRLFVLTDHNVMRVWGGQVLSLLGGGGSAAALVVEPGETSKSVGTLERCWDWLAERGARRDDVVVALGGGVVGDLGGFAAATYQRGVGLWQIPTSLLAQVDSSVGGKTAVNLGAGKNLVGAFYQPDLVVIDPAPLCTLPGPDYVGGLGEVVKHALLISDPFLSCLESEARAVLERDQDVMTRLAKASVAYKAGVVEEDEREKGRRAVLNLGHTTAHALEVVEGYGSLGHGQAVALGLLVALAVSERLLGLDPGVRERTRSLLGRFGLPTSIGLPPADLLLGAAARDKKVTSGSSGFVGLRGVGDPVWGLDVPGEVYAEALEVIKE